MIERQLGLNTSSPSNNPALPVVMSQSTDSAERDLILRQLFLLRQDVEFLKQLASKDAPPQSNIGVPLVNQRTRDVSESLHISEDSEYFIKNSILCNLS